MLSKAVWAVHFGKFTHNWGNYLFMTQIPSYLKDVLKFDIKSNGLVSSIPYITCALFMTIFSILSDKLLATGWFSKKNTRRVFIGIGTILPACFIFGLSFATCQHFVLAVVLLSLGVAFE
jgi:ACS family sodium-dependent inorganic phosphate cotransporter-like MFS transporter 5